MLEERVYRDAAPARVELRPLGHARDVLHEVLSRQTLEVRPPPGDRCGDEAIDREGPAREVAPRRRSRREHREVGHQMLAWRHGARLTASAPPLARKAACGEILRHRTSPS